MVTEKNMNAVFLALDGILYLTKVLENINKGVLTNEEALAELKGRRGRWQAIEDMPWGTDKKE